MIAIIVAIASSVGGSNPDHSDSAAIAQCQVNVQNELKSPSTANFQEATAAGGPPDWTVDGTVDSQNSFAAIVRSSYECDVDFSGSSGTVVVKYLEDN